MQRIIWDQQPLVDVWPTHYWCNGDTRPCGKARYRIGDTVQHKREGLGPVTVVKLGVSQFRWSPPEVVYHLSDGGICLDWELH